MIRAYDEAAYSAAKAAIRSIRDDAVYWFDLYTRTSASLAKLDIELTDAKKLIKELKSFKAAYEALEE